ncbi:hypothetical protein FHS57_004578 [Runella defluvii]|uniref:Thiol-activated cytolysin n=1 Tax=Runella defluvii TaxID=370973 RepID=A0A7W5ZNF7_9BACT|nr:thiol-activated cytolysin family protein [Runella defluvii]MBB3840558.1 hypothetical protein [Runella defluvii]
MEALSNVSRVVLIVLFYFLLLPNELISQVKYRKTFNYLRGKISNPEQFLQKSKFALRDSIMGNPALKNLPFKKKIELAHRYQPTLGGVTPCNQSFPSSNSGSTTIRVIRAGQSFYENSEQVVGTVVNGNFACTSRRVTVDAQFNEQALFLPDNDLIYPGAIINGTSVPNGSLSVYSLPPNVRRMPYQISALIASGSHSTLQTVDTLYNRAEVIRKVNNLVRNAIVPQTFSLEFIKGSNREEFTAKLGSRTTAHLGPELMSLLAGVPLAVDVEQETRLDAQNNRQTSYMLIKVLRTYFDISADPRNDDPRNFFNNPNNIDCNAMYVASVTYGSMAYILVKTTRTDARIEALFSRYAGANFEDSNVRTSFTAELNAVYNTNETTITGTVIGGPANTVNIGTGNALANYITNLPEWSINTGLGTPLAYTLRFLTDDTFATLAINTSFNVQNCTRIAENYELKLTSIECEEQEDFFGNDDIFGTIRVRRSGGSRITPSNWHKFWKQSRNNPVSFNSGSSITTNGSRTYKVPLNSPNPSVSIETRLKEKDTDPDDILSNDSDINLRTTQATMIPLSVGGARYYLHFKVRPIPQ